MRIKSLCMLGKGHPVQTRNNGASMCAIGLHKDLGLIRIYPIPALSKVPVWSFIEAELDRSSSDTRAESWKIVSDIYVSGGVTDPQCKRELLDRCELKSGVKDPVDFLNENRMSIGLIKAKAVCGSLKLNEAFDGDDGACPFDDVVKCQGDFQFAPYLDWQSLQGKNHSQKIVSNEVHMGLIHYPQNPNCVFDNMRIYDPDFTKWILIGNQKDRRTSFVVVHVHRLKGKNDPVFTKTFCNPMLGTAEGWPYSRQGVGNAKPVEPQMDLFKSTTSDICETVGLGRVPTLT